MFDFFSEIIEYLGQTVSIINWGFDFIRNFFGYVQYCSGAVQTLITGFPLQVTAFILLNLSVWSFDFVRGR